MHAGWSAINARDQGILVRFSPSYLAKNDKD